MILAGGRGSRLHQLTDWRAKPAVPFGGKFRIIDFVLSNCVNSGIRRIGVATQYKSHSLIQHIQRGWSFLNGQFGEFIDVLPAQQRIEEMWYRGTADAVFQNLDIMRATNPDYVLILAGDHVYKMDYGKLLAFHVEKQADMTVACIEVPIKDASGFGVMGVDRETLIWRWPAWVCMYLTPTFYTNNWCGTQMIRIPAMTSVRTSSRIWYPRTTACLRRALRKAV
jgi:glucose-1-phosphate adenylyltransferase